ncbi:MAG: helix-turn-helix transcriptional regulator [Pseudomonadota bacterium]
MTPRERAEQASKTFPARLKALRKGAGMTQDQLAELAGCSSVALSKFESGVNLPSFENLVALSASLCIPVDDLVGSFQNEESTNPKLSAARARLDQAVQGLSADWVDTLTDLAKKAK